MVEKEKPAKRVVLDTNILISSILFKGELARFVDLWKGGEIIPIVSKETFNEFRNVLEYPKFRLTSREIKAIIENEVLPFFEVVETVEKKAKVCKDPDDNKFIACALSASADYVVSGDKNLCDIGSYRSIKIIKASELLAMFE